MIAGRNYHAGMFIHVMALTAAVLGATWLLTGNEAALAGSLIAGGAFVLEAARSSARH